MDTKLMAFFLVVGYLEGSFKDGRATRSSSSTDTLHVHAKRSPSGLTQFPADVDDASHPAYSEDCRVTQMCSASTQL